MKLKLKRDALQHSMIGLFAAGFMTLGLAGYAEETQVRISVPDMSSVSLVKQTVESAGGKVIELLPEGKVLASFPYDNPVLPAKFNAEKVVAPSQESTPSKRVATPVTGINTIPVLPPEVQAQIDAAMVPYAAPQPNELAKTRAKLGGASKAAVTLPNRVDNSLSEFFPPIGDAGTQGSEVSWANAYYQNTYTQARDEGVYAFGGDASVLNSPAFNFNTINMGDSSISSIYNIEADATYIANNKKLDKTHGSFMEYSLYKLMISGCGSMADMPYSSTDWLSWPSQKAWTNGLKNKIKSFSRIGDYSTDLRDTDIANIKQELANGRLVTTRMRVYPAFTTAFSSTGAVDVKGNVSNGVFYNHVTMLPSGYPNPATGSTALTIVGYDDYRSYGSGFGAFLMVAPYGSGYGTKNASNHGGYVWVSYELFKNANVFGTAYVTMDIPQYRPRLWASCGVNALERGWISMWGGIGLGSINDVDALPGNSVWTSLKSVDRDGGVTNTLPMISDEPVVIDMTEGLTEFEKYASGPSDLAGAVLFVGVECNAMSDWYGEVYGAKFYFDPSGTGSPKEVDDPGIYSLSTGSVVTTKVAFPLVNDSSELAVTNPEIYVSYGKPAGNFSPESKVYTLQNGSDAVALNYNISSDVPWIQLSKSTGSIPASGTDTVRATLVQNIAKTYKAGVYNGHIWLVNLKSGAESDDLILLPVQMVVTQMALEYFIFNSVDESQKPGVGFPMLSRAMGLDKDTVGSYNDYANILVKEKILRGVGVGSEMWEFPWNTYYKRGRTQSIYKASELPGKGSITALRMNVQDFGGEIQNLNIRMRHTTLDTYADTKWQGDGWQTVYTAASLKFTENGWYKFTLQTPFVYDGKQNLMIDYSFDNIAWSKPTIIRATNTKVNRSLTAAADNFTTVPIGWGTSSYSPPATLSTYVPNLHVFVEGDVLSATPTAEQQFKSGVWRGNVTVMKPCDNVVVQAVDLATGKNGESNIFSVVNVPVIDVTPTAINVTSAKGKNPAEQVFLIRNIGNGTLNYSASVNASWLGTQPGSGTCTNEVNRVSVVYNTASLPVGIYNATITIVDSTKPGVAPVYIPVRLTVTHK